jgi:hypothetical protein
MFLEPCQSHTIEEPNWMFEYLQETFSSNYLTIKSRILTGLHQNISGSILVYILQYCTHSFFYQNIKRRMEIDLPDMKEAYPFFRFFDTL